MRLILATQATAAALLFSSPAANAAPMKVSGTFTGSCTMQDPHPLADAGKVLVSQICKAKNVGAPFDGDDVTFSQIIELDQGNGSQTGQNAILDSKGTTTNEYRGTIRTKMVDGQPRTTRIRHLQGCRCHGCFHRRHGARQLRPDVHIGNRLR